VHHAIALLLEIDEVTNRIVVTLQELDLLVQSLYVASNICGVIAILSLLLFISSGCSLVKQLLSFVVDHKTETHLSVFSETAFESVSVFHHVDANPILFEVFI
jgi:hypothetical protein